MSEYVQYYTSADTNVYFENPITGNQVHIDTLLSVSWVEKSTAGPVYGLGNQTFSFINKGNTLVQGAIVCAFIDEQYFDFVFRELNKSNKKAHDPNTYLSVFKNGTNESATEIASILKEQKNRPLQNNGINLFPAGSNGIHLLPSGFNIRVALNNRGLFREDSDKYFVIENCKIISRQVESSVTNGGEAISIAMPFLAKTVRT